MRYWTVLITTDTRFYNDYGSPYKVWGSIYYYQKISYKMLRHVIHKWWRGYIIKIWRVQ